jgi:acyl-CoA synthetase (AMP-forming)/AMP-acid ligase II
VDYATLANGVEASLQVLVGCGLSALGAGRHLPRQRIETVVACFGAAAAGGAFVPLNPLLKAEQVGTSCATATCACS